MDNRTNRTLEIHKLALAELDMPTKKLPTRRLFVELKGLKTTPPTREWLEAAILMCVFRVSRPMKALVFINKLRSMAKSASDKKRFDEFHAAWAAHLSPVLLTNHGYIDPAHTFGQASHDEIWTGLESHMTAMKNAGLRVFLDSGPLLGLVRDGKLIDHDNDIDLALILEGDSEEAVAAEWKTIPDKLRALNIFSEGSERNHGLLRLTPVAGFTIDVFPAWIIDNKAYVFPHTFGELSSEDVFPFSACKITGLDQPAEPEKMLAINYGKGWQTYDPLWKFVRPKGFDSFLALIEPEDAAP